MEYTRNLDHLVLDIIDVTQSALMLYSLDHLAETFRHVRPLVQILHISLTHACLHNEFVRWLYLLQILSHPVLGLHISIISFCQ